MSAQRGNFHLAGHLRTGAGLRTFLKSGKSANPLPPFSRLICKARGMMQ